MMSSALPAATPPNTSNRTTSPNSLRPMRWASVPPMLPAPMRAILLRAIRRSFRDAPVITQALAISYQGAGGREPMLGPGAALLADRIRPGKHDALQHERRQRGGVGLLPDRGGFRANAGFRGRAGKDSTWRARGPE